MWRSRLEHACMMMKEEVKNSSDDWIIHYICRDYLGSITSVTNAAGSVIQELSYDAWGSLCDPKTRALYTSAMSLILF